MHHVQEICVGKAASPDETKMHLGSTGPTGRKIVPNTTHFRTIAPKVSPKIVSSCLSSSYPPSMPDIAPPGSKPLIINTQNYTLMKVASHDGTFSLVALPQVSPPMGGSVIQTTGIPLHENPKLPIPRYQPTQSKKQLNKKAKVLNKPKVGKSAVLVTQDRHSESITKFDPKQEAQTRKHIPMTAAEDADSESSIFLGSGTEVGKVNNCALPCVEKGLPTTFSTGSPINLSVDAERADNGTLVRCKSNKVVDSTNSLSVLSPMVFGSPVHFIQSVPKGKLPILPYSKIKKSVVSKCNQSAGLGKIPLVNVGRSGVQTSSKKVQATPPSITVPHVSAPDGPCQPNVGILRQQTGVVGKKRGKKRKASGETGCQPKMKLVGSKLIVCKDKVRAQVVNESDKKFVSVKKYRNIMPKPIVEIQSLASLGASTSVLQAHLAESTIRHRLLSIRPHRWKQGDHFSLTQNNDCKMSSAAKVVYKCHICDHSFQFKHHLQDHLNSHTNKRPYHCRLCRKAYVHSGSLSTHMKLHHSESRLKKLMCCEFCAKVFGHIRVYFGHLKEVHRVIISTESSVKQLEKKILTLKVKDEVNSLDRNKNGSHEDDTIPGQADKIRLKIKCGRCSFIAPTFSDMKPHLFREHGEEFGEILQEGVLEQRQGAQEEVGKQATHHWKLLSERRNVVKCHSYGEEPVGSSRLGELVRISDTAHSEFSEVESTPSREGQESSSQKDLPSGSCTEVKFCCGNHFNCLLCKEVFEVQNKLFEHWEKQHNCENPLVLWTVFSSLLKKQEETS
ncbi:zinc finger protein 438 [Mixophyes fleayi]|uniref:zinc finger protein 438 n=1 Tax=Mixophyes fleayi TaxID=3061075 RepID=UPI003F4D9FC4